MCVLVVKSSARYPTRSSVGAIDDDVRRGEPGRAPEALVPVAGRRVDDLDRRGAHRSSTRKSGWPYSTSSAFSRADLDDRAGHPRDDRVHHLHHLDQADDGVRLDGAPTVDVRRRARRLGAVEGAEHRAVDRVRAVVGTPRRCGRRRRRARTARPTSALRRGCRRGLRPATHVELRARRCRSAARRAPTRRSAAGSRGRRRRSEPIYEPSCGLCADAEGAHHERHRRRAGRRRVLAAASVTGRVWST